MSEFIFANPLRAFRAWLQNRIQWVDRAIEPSLMLRDKIGPAAYSIGIRALYRQGI